MGIAAWCTFLYGSVEMCLRWQSVCVCVCVGGGGGGGGAVMFCFVYLRQLQQYWHISSNGQDKIIR